MTYRYQVLRPTALSEESIQAILDLWQISAWKGMDTETFRRQFSQSEFHVLSDAAKGALQCIARINHDFTLTIAGRPYTFAELVGLVAAEQGRGSGKNLMSKISHNLQERNLQTIGFCNKELRPFYEKCGVTILHDRAGHIYEQTDAGWVPSDDDDILDINLSSENNARLRALDKSNVAYYTPSSSLT
jgi:GNAT superfamily N-acetyltransferase